tara:strand:- start:2076 stop:2330 length:255 start_codon:yes stop_codon:yes gene_type:complete
MPSTLSGSGSGAGAAAAGAVGVTIPVAAAGITFFAAAPLGLEPIGGWEKTDEYGDRRSRKDCVKRAKEREREASRGEFKGGVDG